MKPKKGFTIVELSFSIAFIAVLSIIVLLIISNAVSAYHRGLTLNKLNTTGMDLVDDMRTAVQSSPAILTEKECTSIYTNPNTAKACVDSKAIGFTVVKKKANARIGKTNISNVPVYGAFCTGKYSYLWNTGYFFNSEGAVNGASALKLSYKLSGSSSVATVDNFKLLKVEDEDRLVCKIGSGVNLANANGGKYDLGNNMPNTIDISSKSIDDTPTDILAGDNNLVLYDLTASVPARFEKANNMFYAASFILGTIQGGINVTASGNYCSAPEDYNRAETENFDYCAINKFNFAAQAIGG